jgi:hypothetical protein
MKKKPTKSLYILTHQAYEKIYAVIDKFEKDVKKYRPKKKLRVNIELN